MKRKHILIGSIVIILIICVAVSVTFLFSNNIGKAYFNDLTVTSPDGEHMLIIREWETIGGTGADIYYVGSDSYRAEKLIGHTAADDCCYPFFNGDYSIVWREDSVLITYYSGRDSQSADDPSTWEIAELYFNY